MPQGKAAFDGIVHKLLVAHPILRARIARYGDKSLIVQPIDVASAKSLGSSRANKLDMIALYDRPLFRIALNTETRTAQIWIHHIIY